MTKPDHEQKCKDADAVCDWVLENIDGAVQSLGHEVMAASVMTGVAIALITMARGHGMSKDIILHAFSKNLQTWEEQDQCDDSGKLLS